MKQAIQSKSFFFIYRQYNYFHKGLRLGYAAIQLLSLSTQAAVKIGY